MLKILFLLQKPTTTCGARDILQSFGTDFLSDMFESRNRRNSNTGVDHRPEPPKALGKEAEDLSLTPKIMASYESISVTSQTHPQLRSDEDTHSAEFRSHQINGIQDRDREDGADSIVQDE